MVDVEVRAEGLDEASLAARLRAELAAVDPDAVVRLDVRGEVDERARDVLRAARLRELTPPGVTLETRRPRPKAPTAGRGSAL